MSEQLMNIPYQHIVDRKLVEVRDTQIETPAWLQDVAEADAYLVIPRGACQVNGEWQPGTLHIDNKNTYKPYGGGPQLGSLRPFAINKLIAMDMLRPGADIVVPSGKHGDMPFAWNQSMIDSIKKYNPTIEEQHELKPINHSLDTASEMATWMLHCAENNIVNAAEITDATQIAREDMFRAMIMAAYPDDMTEEYDWRIIGENINRVAQHTMWDIFKDDKTVEDLLEYTKQRKIAEGDPEDKTGELRRIHMAHAAAKMGAEYFMPKTQTDVLQMSQAFLNNYNNRYGGKPDLLGIATREVMATLRQTNHRTTQVTAEDILTVSPDSSTFHMDVLTNSKAYMRILASELAGIADMCNGTYNDCSDQSIAFKNTLQAMSQQYLEEYCSMQYQLSEQTQYA